MNKKVILTGIRANNDLTLGNYFGAILPIIDMAKKRADEYQVNLFVPDLHSFTTPIDHNKLQEQIMHNLRVFAAAGLPLGHPDVHVYRQSYVPAHSELTWILDCFTGFGEMNRMIEFKDKSKIKVIEAEEVALQKKAVDNFHSLLASKGVDTKDGKVRAFNLTELNDIDPRIIQELMNFFMQFTALRASKEEAADKVGVGLFNYPVLMAADILLYSASYVPVGEDQTQHLEFTRDIGERMNSRFGELFVIPEAVKKQHEFFGKDQGLRIKDLQDPSKKMSKSDETGKGVIFLGDEPEVAAKKIMSAATDSLGVIKFDWTNQPGITNLLQLLALATERPQADVNKQWEGTTKYGDLKKAVADAITGFLQGLQHQLSKVDDQELMAKIEASEAEMREMANKTLLKVQKAVGLR